MSAIRVIQFTDPHLFSDPAGSLRGVNTLETLERTLSDASGHLAIADAILVTGDLVQDDAGGYAHFRRLFARYGKPVLCIPGNHDFVPQMREALASRPFELDGPADIGAWRFVLLDSVVPLQAGGRISMEMLTKLDEDLGRARHRHAMVCLHHHPVADAEPLARQRRPRQCQRILVRHRQPSAGEGDCLGPRAPGLRRRAPWRAPVRDTLDLRAIPAALRPVRHRLEPPAYRLLHVEFQRRDRHWRAFPDCRRIRGMNLPRGDDEASALGLAGLVLFVSACGVAQARDETSVWSIKGERNTVYLAGSVHALPKDQAPFSPQLERHTPPLKSSSWKWTSTT